MAKLTLIDELGNLKADKQNYNEIVPPADNKYYLSAPEYNKLLSTLKELIADYNILKLSSTTFDTYDIIKSGDDATVPTDSHLYTARKTAEEIRKLIDILDFSDYYLSKREDDSADGKITFNKGIDIGSYQEGMRGGHINQNADAELKSLKLREWLEVPELRYNRVEVQMGDKWRAPGGGIIESVDTENQIITLKLEQGEYGAVALNDLCMGIFHSMIPSNNSSESTDDSRNNRTIKGFATSYFKVEELLNPQENNSRFRYSLRPISPRHNKQVHPEAFMNFAAFGNTTNPDRQTSSYETRTYQRYLIDMNDWEITVMNVAAQYGDLSNLNSLGLPPMSGYSVYLKNVYFSGNLQQIKAPKIEDGTWWTWNGEQWVNSGVPATGIPKDGLYFTLKNNNLTIVDRNPSFDHTWAELHVYEGNRELSYTTSETSTRGTYTVSLTSAGVTAGSLLLIDELGRRFAKTSPILGIDAIANSGTIVFKIKGVRFDGSSFNFETSQVFTKVPSGTDGKDIEYIYARTKNNIPPILPIDSLNEDGYVPPADGDIVWTPDPVGVTDVWEYEWYAKREKINGVWSNWRNLLQWRYHVADGVNGIDGATREYIYTVNNDSQFYLPENRPTTSEQYPDYVPKKANGELVDWFDDPQNPGPENQYEWYCYRDKTGGNAAAGIPGTWGQFNGPYLWSKYAKNGDKGDKGDPGEPSFTLLLSNEAHTFAGTTTTAIGGSTVTKVISYKGSTAITPTSIVVGTMPTGMSASVSGTTITFTVTSQMTSASGTVPITVVLDGKSLVVHFSYAISFKGTDGEHGKTISVTGATQTIHIKDGVRTPNTNFTVVGTASNTTITSWTYSVNGGNFSSTVPTGLSRSSNTVTINPLNVTATTISIRASDGTISDTFTISVVSDGSQGPPGTGVPIVYRGLYDSGANYYGTPTRQDIVKYNNWYYIARQDAGDPFNTLPTDSVGWDSFGGSFESVATSLLLAEKANIANFAFIDQKMISQTGVDAVGNIVKLESDNTAPSGYVPNLYFDGILGEISVGAGKIKLFSDGSGYLANNNLRWNSDGTLLIGLAPTGKDGESGLETLTTEFSITGNGNWHTNYAVGDKYMRSRVGNGLWSDVVRIVEEVFPVEFSVDGATNWHANYFDGDLYKRVKIDGVWGDPIKLTVNPTPLKPFKEYQFANNTSSTTPPATNSSLWTDAPTPLTTKGQYMWMRARTVTHNTIIPTEPPTNPNYIEPYSYGAWETPSRITKLEGYSPLDIDSAIKLNPNGSGYLAMGNISWDSLGNLEVKGVFESSSDTSAAKIIIDSSYNTHLGGKIARISGYLPTNPDYEIFNIGYDIGLQHPNYYYSGNINLKQVRLPEGPINAENLTLTDSMDISAGKIGMTSYPVTDNFDYHSYFGIGQMWIKAPQYPVQFRVDTTFGELIIWMMGLPTNRANAIVGQVYLDGEILKVRTT